MANYTKATDFAAKDGLTSGDPAKIVKGTEIDDEFNAIVTAVNSKANVNSPAFTGVPTAPTAVSGTSNTQVATTAFTSAAVNALIVDTDAIADDAVTTAKIAPTGVTAGTYGSATEIPSIVVNAEGQVTSATTNTITIDEPIGVGQTWQSVSRSLNSTYTNTTGRPIQVMASVRCQGSSTPARAYVDDLMISNSYAADCCGVPQTPVFPLSFIVPAGSTYKCTGAQNVRWYELR